MDSFEFQNKFIITCLTRHSPRSSTALHNLEAFLTAKRDAMSINEPRKELGELVTEAKVIR